ncbi:MAG: GntR family transcriptional regulator [Firmicutes bacterium]|nr:GntR family transcriptional regulator [Bacillota bacterium]MDH7494811.1 GntR family transcriptional regulator [Bacillota bacterium]
MIDRLSNIPLYVQVYNAMRDNITSHKWLPRERLPSEAELVEQFNVSRITVRRAVDELVRDGLVIRQKGLGAFIAPPRHSSSVTMLTSLTEDLIEKGFHPGTEILDFSVVPATEDLARRLVLSPGDKVFRVERRRFADDRVVALNLSYIPCRLCPTLSRQDVAVGSLYGALEAKYGLRIKKAIREFEMIEAADYEARLLEVPVGTPILRITGTVSTADGSVVDYHVKHYK